MLCRYVVEPFVAVNPVVAVLECDVADAGAVAAEPLRVPVFDVPLRCIPREEDAITVVSEAVGDGPAAGQVVVDGNIPHDAAVVTEHEKAVLTVAGRGVLERAALTASDRDSSAAVAGRLVVADRGAKRAGAALD